MRNYKIFDSGLVIDSMKDSGYKDAAHAVAELIDNSIQAGEECGKTSVEIICLEKKEAINGKNLNRIQKIAVFDNAAGMSIDVLSSALAFGQGTRKGASTGMGKFGMGLPNASISQCNRVDVWSWQNGEMHHTYLDVDEIQEKRSDTLPIPQKVNSLPEDWRKRIKSETQGSGTLVVWSRLERLKWARHKAFFSNTEFIIGRMYRHFIKGDKCEIRMAAYNHENEKLYDELVRVMVNPQNIVQF